MKLEDIFFGIGISIIAALLVFVVYDDTIGSSYHEYMEGNMSLENNMSENATLLASTNRLNNTIDLMKGTKEKTTSVQSSNEKSVSQSSDTSTSSVQSSKSPKNNGNANIKTSSNEFKPSSYSNTRKDKVSNRMNQFKPKNNK